MDNEQKYKEALERAKKLKETCDSTAVVGWCEYIFPELKESEDDRMWALIKKYAHYNISDMALDADHITREELESWLEKQVEPSDKGEISDGFHTFNELYYYRMLYNAAFFNMLPKEWVHKSKKHNDGEECFGGGWFIVMANLPTGQISNHYELKDWDLFQIPEKERADKWDGHTPQEAAERLHNFLLEKQASKPKWSEEDDYNVQCCIAKVERDIANGYHGRNKELIEWLKSLRTQNRWIPSDEQINAIRLARTFVVDDFSENPTLSEILMGLEEQLNKLKGE